MKGETLTKHTSMLVYPVEPIVEDQAHMLVRWERTYRRTCPVTGNPVTFEQVLAGQYSLPRLDGNSDNGYEVWPRDEYLRDLVEVITKYLD